MADNPGESSNAVGSSPGPSDSATDPEPADSMAAMHSRIDGLFSELSTKQDGIEKLHGYLNEERKKREKDLQGRSNPDRANKQHETSNGAEEMQQLRENLHKQSVELKRVKEEKERMDRVNDLQKAYINEMLRRHFNQSPLDEEHSMADILHNNNLEQNLKEQEAKNSTLEKALKETSSDLKNKEGIIGGLRKDLEVRKEELEQKNAEIQRHLKDLGAKEANIANLQGEKKTEQEKSQKIEEAQQSLKEKAERLEKELLSAENDSKNLNEMVAVLTEDRNFLRTRIGEMTAVIAKNLEHSEETVKALKKIMDDGVTALKQGVKEEECERFEKFMNYRNEGIIKYTAICIIADKLTEDWKMVGGFLGVDMYEMERIDKNIHNVEDKVLKMLAIWCNMNPEKAVLKTVVQALRKNGRNDIADQISNLT